MKGAKVENTTAELKVWIGDRVVSGLEVWFG